MLCLGTLEEDKVESRKDSSEEDLVLEILIWAVLYFGLPRVLFPPHLRRKACSTFLSYTLVEQWLERLEERRRLEETLMDLGGDKEGVEEEESDLEDLLHPKILPRGSTEEGAWRGLSSRISTSEVNVVSPTRPGQDVWIGTVGQGRLFLVLDLVPVPRQYAPRHVEPLEQRIQEGDGLLNIGLKNPPDFCLENWVRSSISPS